MKGPLVKILVGAGALTASFALAATASAAPPADVSGSGEPNTAISSVRYWHGEPETEIASDRYRNGRPETETDSARYRRGQADQNAPSGNAGQSDGNTGEPDKDAPAGHAGATTKAEQKAVIDYWSPEKMRNAKPVNGKKDRAGRSELSAAVSSKAQAGGARTAQSSSSAQASRVSTDPRLGKIFFSMDGEDHVCSGTVTHGDNHEVVTTAGHCINDGSGAFASKVAFVPAYDDGHAPYGTWTAKQFFTTQQWKSDRDFNYDVGFAVMNDDSKGETITDIAGSYGIAFNQDRGLAYHNYGYPAAKPYGGQHVYSCNGKAHDDAKAGTSSQGIPCTMTAGSSGGGWIEHGYVNSVNSYKYDEDPDTMYGPYFGPSVKNAWTAASDYS